MKKLSMLFVIFTAFFMFVACDNNIKFSPARGDIDSGDTADDSDTPDTSDTSTEQPDSGDSQSGDDTDTATDDYSDTDNTAKEACFDIYQCMTECGQDNSCQQACLDNGSAEGQEIFMTMYNCWTQNCANEQTQDGFINCVTANCKAETEACSIIVDDGNSGDTSYANPYGSVALDFSIDQVANSYSDQQYQVGVVSSAFATGIYGNGSASVVPEDIFMVQTGTIYSTGSQFGSGVMIQQVPVYAEGQQGVSGNPVVILFIPEENAVVSALDLSILQNNSQAQLYVVDVNWSTSQIDCFHAFGEGTVNITNVGDITNHGALVFNGNATLYSPKNYKSYGDISSQLNGATVCEPVQ